MSRNQSADGVMQRVLSCVLAACAMTSANRALGRQPTLDVIGAQALKQWQRIDSLHLRLRQDTVVGESMDAVAWQSTAPEGLPAFSGKEDVLFALRGAERYLRVIGLDHHPMGDSLAERDGSETPSKVSDITRVWRENAVVERTKSRTAFEYRVLRLPEAAACLPSPRYLKNIGFATLDPTASSAFNDRIRKTWFLPEILRSSSYRIHPETERVAGRACLIVEFDKAAPDATTKIESDKLWLDVECANALRKRELRIGDRSMRIVNTDFKEAMPNVWMPAHSQIEYFLDSRGKAPLQGVPDLVQRMGLACLVLNEVPAELFDVASTKRPPFPASLFAEVPAYHYRDDTRVLNNSVEDVWAAKGLGRRKEIRTNGELESMSLDTPMWTAIWVPARNRVTVLPSRLKQNLRDDAAIFIRHRKRWLRLAENSSAVSSVRRERIDGRVTDKMTSYFPVDPATGGKAPIHGFFPKQQLVVSGTSQRTRVFWFNRETGLMVYRRCGCAYARWPEGKHVKTVEYPPLDTVRPDRFTFRMPENAGLVARGEELRRLFLSSQ